MPEKNWLHRSKWTFPLEDVKPTLLITFCIEYPSSSSTNRCERRIQNLTAPFLANCFQTENFLRIFYPKFSVIAMASISMVRSARLGYRVHLFGFIQLFHLHWFNTQRHFSRQIFRLKLRNWEISKIFFTQDSALKISSIGHEVRIGFRAYTKLGKQANKKRIKNKMDNSKLMHEKRSLEWAKVSDVAMESAASLWHGSMLLFSFIFRKAHRA